MELLVTHHARHRKQTTKESRELRTSPVGPQFLEKPREQDKFPFQWVWLKIQKSCMIRQFGRIPVEGVVRINQ